MSVKKGRVIKLEVGPKFFEYCQVRGGKLNFLLGKINCAVSNAFVPDVEILTSEMEVESINKSNNELNAKQSVSLSTEPSTEQLPELSSEPMDSPLSPASATAVEELLSEAEERKKIESEGWTKVSREVRNRRSNSTNRSDDLRAQNSVDREYNHNHFSSRISNSTPTRVSRGAERAWSQSDQQN